MSGLNRRADIDIARGGVLLMVVVWHATVYLNLEPNRTVDRVNSLMALARMPTLLLLSGILAGGLLRKPAAAAKERFLDLSWLFLLWMPFLMIVRALHGLTELSLAHILVEIVGPTGDLWYIWVLGFGSASLAFMRPSWRALVLILMAVVSVLSFAWVLRFNNLTYDRIAQFGVFFYAGAFFRSELLKAPSVVSVKRLCCAAASLVAVDLFGTVLEMRFGWEVLGLAEAALTCVLILLAAGAVQHIRLVEATFGWFGRNTLPIYLAHSHVIMLIGFWLPIESRPGVVVVPIVAATAVAASLLLERVLKVSGMGWLYARPRGLGRRVAEGARVLARHARSLDPALTRMTRSETAGAVSILDRAASGLTPVAGGPQAAGASAATSLSIHADPSNDDVVRAETPQAA